MFNFFKKLFAKLFGKKSRPARGEWTPKVNPPKRSKQQGPSIHAQKKTHKARIMDKIRKASRKINRGK